MNFYLRTSLLVSKLPIKKQKRCSKTVTGFHRMVRGRNSLKISASLPLIKIYQMTAFTQISLTGRYLLSHSILEGWSCKGKNIKDLYWQFWWILCSLSSSLVGLGPSASSSESESTTCGQILSPWLGEYSQGLRIEPLDRAKYTVKRCLISKLFGWEEKTSCFITSLIWERDSLFRLESSISFTKIFRHKWLLSKTTKKLCIDL